MISNSLEEATSHRRWVLNLKCPEGRGFSRPDAVTSLSQRADCIRGVARLSSEIQYFPMVMPDTRLRFEKYQLRFGGFTASIRFDGNADRVANKSSRSGMAKQASSRSDNAGRVIRTAHSFCVRYISMKRSAARAGHGSCEVGDAMPCPASIHGASGRVAPPHARKILYRHSAGRSAQDIGARAFGVAKTGTRICGQWPMRSLCPAQPVA